MQEIFLTKFTDALEIEDREVLMSDHFRDYDEWDSLTRLSLIAMLDEEFDLQIENEKFENLLTVEDLYQMVSSSKK